MDTGAEDQYPLLPVNADRPNDLQRRSDSLSDGLKVPGLDKIVGDKIAAHAQT